MKQLSATTLWKDIKSILKEDKRYEQLKSSSLKEKLFEEFMISEILTDVGQKRSRLVAQGGNDELVQQIDKQEKKRLKKEESQSLSNFKALLKEKVTEVNVSK